MLELLLNPWIGLFLGGFATNGFITQIAAITPTKKDDAAVSILGMFFKTLTGTHGLKK